MNQQQQNHRLWTDSALLYYKRNYSLKYFILVQNALNFFHAPYISQEKNQKSKQVQTFCEEKG